MSLDYTYADPPLRTKRGPQSTAPALATWLLLGVSFVATCQSVYFDARAESNYAASAELHGTLSLLEQQRREEIADFDSLNGKLTELLAKQEKQDAQ